MEISKIMLTVSSSKIGGIRGKNNKKTHNMKA